MKLMIKNMVCPRCISAVEQILVSEGVKVRSITLGDVETEDGLSDEQLLSVAKQLQGMGFELLDDPRSQIVEQIRINVLEWVRMTTERPKLSDFLSRRSSFEELFQYLMTNKNQPPPRLFRRQWVLQKFSSFRYRQF